MKIHQLHIQAPCRAYKICVGGLVVDVGGCTPPKRARASALQVSHPLFKTQVICTLRFFQGVA